MARALAQLIPQGCWSDVRGAVRLDWLVARLSGIAASGQAGLAAAAQMEARARKFSQVAEPKPAEKGRAHGRTVRAARPGPAEPAVAALPFGHAPASPQEGR